MKPIQVASTDDEDAQLPFVVPIKGRNPISIVVPRFDFLSEVEFEAIENGLKALDEDETLSGRKKTVQIALVMLRQFVTKAQLVQLEKLPPGVLDDLLHKWRAYSTVTLGNLRPS